MNLEDICVIEGPGHLECWGCPVVQCPGWESPFNPLSPETQAVALRAAKELHDAKVVVEGESYRDVDAMDLALAVSSPSVAEKLRVGMAAEAIMQNTLLKEFDTEERRVMQTWIEHLRGRAPTEADDEWLERTTDIAKARVAGRFYGAPANAVYDHVNYLRNRSIKRRSKA